MENNCELNSYHIYILDSELEEVSGLSGYTKNNAFTDFKIKDYELYYYSLSTEGEQYTLNYYKMNFNDLLKQDYEKYEKISTVDNCSFPME